MDYFDILKRALKVTWKYKALWVLGFFVGAGSGGSGGSSGYRSSVGNNTGSTGTTPFDVGFQRAFESADRWVTDNIATVDV